MAEGGFIHREVLDFQATPAQMREFIMTPQRIVDYNPAAIEAGVLEEGHSVWFRTDTGVTLVERVEDECTDECVVVVAYVASVEPPYGAEAVRAAATITLYEDWELEEIDGGTRLTKIWRDASSTFDLPFSLDDSIREMAAGESEILVERWNEAARQDA